MVTKFKYFNKNGIVSRTPDYSFTAIEELSSRLTGIDNDLVITSIANTTLKGESERHLIEAEDAWFKMGEIHELSGNINEAKNCYQKCISEHGQKYSLNSDIVDNAKKRVEELNKR